MQVQEKQTHLIIYSFILYYRQLLAPNLAQKHFLPHGAEQVSKQVRIKTFSFIYKLHSMNLN